MRSRAHLIKVTPRVLTGLLVQFIHISLDGVRLEAMQVIHFGNLLFPVFVLHRSSLAQKGAPAEGSESRYRPGTTVTNPLKSMLPLLRGWPASRSLTLTSTRRLSASNLRTCTKPPEASVDCQYSPVL